MKKKLLKPIAEVGSGKDAHLSMNYHDIVKMIFPPNVTKLDDPDKVKASWGCQDSKGRKVFIWCYKYYGAVSNCNEWSVCGDKDLIIELFGDKVKYGY